MEFLLFCSHLTSALKAPRVTNATCLYSSNTCLLTAKPPEEQNEPHLSPLSLSLSTHTPHFHLSTFLKRHDAATVCCEMLCRVMNTP